MRLRLTAVLLLYSDRRIIVPSKMILHALIAKCIWRIDSRLATADEVRWVGTDAHRLLLIRFSFALIHETLLVTCCSWKIARPMPLRDGKKPRLVTQNHDSLNSKQSEMFKANSGR